eukprot:1624444-Lingulodinium_polyedra.AAC.1
MAKARDGLRGLAKKFVPESRLDVAVRRASDTAGQMSEGAPHVHVTAPALLGRLKLREPRFDGRGNVGGKIRAQMPPRHGGKLQRSDPRGPEGTNELPSLGSQLPLPSLVAVAVRDRGRWLRRRPCLIAAVRSDGSELASFIVTGTQSSMASGRVGSSVRGGHRCQIH